MRAKMIAVAASIAVVCMTPFPTRADDARFEQCKAKLVRASELGVLHAFDWKPPKEPYVVVGSTFIDMTIDAKEGFAETVNCFLMGGESGKYINFDVLHYKTGKAIGQFKNGRFSML